MKQVRKQEIKWLKSKGTSFQFSDANVFGIVELSDPVIQTQTFFLTLGSVNMTDMTDNFSYFLNFFQD